MRRLIKVDNGVVVDCIIAEGLLPWIREGWIDATGLTDRGSLVSVGFQWDGLHWRNQEVSVTIRGKQPNEPAIGSSI